MNRNDQLESLGLGEKVEEYQPTEEEIKQTFPSLEEDDEGDPFFDEGDWMWDEDGFRRV